MTRSTWARIGLLAAAGCSNDGSFCTTSADCGNVNEECVYPIGSCAATGQCQTRTDPCDHVTELCGCSGEIVAEECWIPSGFATGPTTGEVPVNEMCSGATGDP